MLYKRPSLPFKDPEVRRAYLKAYDHKRGKHTIMFRGKQVRLKFSPRKGICSECGKVGRTNMHHDIYDETNVLANTRELCFGCHRNPITGRFI